MRMAVILAFSVSMPVAAETVFKCVDAAGKVTFTQQACPDSTGLADVVRAHNSPPSAGGSPVRMADQPIRYSPADQSQNQPRKSSVTVVGERVSPCQIDMSAQDHRSAVVSGKAQQGMTAGEIEGMYGEPDTVSSANGETSYRYWNAQDREYVRVDFDKNGCADWIYTSKDN